MTDVPIATLEGCQRGDTQAFAEVVARFERPLFSYVYRLGGLPPGRDVEDVVQEIFVKAYQNIASYQIRTGTAFSTWIFSIARNHYLSLMRRAQLEDHWIQASRQGSCDSQDPTEHLAAAEAASRVQQAIGRLPEAMRSAFLLRYYHDLPYRQIAEILQCNEGTVRSRLARAKKTLREQLLSPTEQPR